MNESNLYLFKDIAEDNDLIFFLYDCKGKNLVYLSEGHKKIWGKVYNMGQDDLSEILSSVHPDDKQYLKEVFAKAINGNFSSNAHHFRIYNSQNKLKHIKLRLYSKLNDHQDYCILGGFLEDVTENRHYEKTLKEYTSKKNGVLEKLVHDLSGPLGMIQNMITLLQEKHTEHNVPHLEEYTNYIQKICKTSIELINDLVTNEYLDFIKVKLKLERIELVQCLKSFFEIYQKSPDVQERKFIFKASKPEIYASIDEVKFIQVLNNLISNAIKFTYYNGTITLNIDEHEKSVIVSVRDNGIGIPDELKPHLFKKYTKASRTGLRGEPSNGLGLYIIKEIIVLHNGKIWYDSEPGKGTTFYIELPKNNLNKL